MIFRVFLGAVSCVRSYVAVAALLAAKIKDLSVLPQLDAVPLGDIGLAHRVLNQNVIDFPFSVPGQVRRLRTTAEHPGFQSPIEDVTDYRQNNESKHRSG
jgi:hypothetical protein